MALIPDELKDRIRNSISLAEVIMADGFTLHAHGRGEWRGDCPFRPSASSAGRRHTKFHVKNDHFRCYDCREKGDIFDWFQKQHGLDFVDAVREAAERAGIDINQYLQPRRQENGPAAHRAVALAALHDLTVQAAAARNLSQDESALASLVNSREVGWLESPQAAIASLRALAVADDTIEGIGLNESMPAGVWLLWSLQRGAPVAARPLGHKEPVLGAYGARTAAWIQSPSARRALAREQQALLVVDDYLYVQLRSLGREAVFLPVSNASLTDGASQLPRVQSLKTPPILMTRPQPTERRAALEAALALLPTSPRLRAAEIDPLPARVSSPERVQRAIDMAAERAGTVLDWQTALVAQHDFLRDEDGRRRAARHLNRIVEATASPLERAVYADAVHALTGIKPARPTRQKSAARS